MTTSETGLRTCTVWVPEYPKPIAERPLFTRRPKGTHEKRCGQPIALVDGKLEHIKYIGRNGRVWTPIDLGHRAEGE